MPMKVRVEKVERITVTTSDGRIFTDATQDALSHEINLILNELVGDALGYEPTDLSSRNVARMLAMDSVDYVGRLSRRIRQAREALRVPLTGS